MAVGTGDPMMAYFVVYFVPRGMIFVGFGKARRLDGEMVDNQRVEFNHQTWEVRVSAWLQRYPARPCEAEWT